MLYAVVYSGVGATRGKELGYWKDPLDLTFSTAITSGFTTASLRVPYSSMPIIRNANYTSTLIVYDHKDRKPYEGMVTDIATGSDGYVTISAGSFLNMADRKLSGGLFYADASTTYPHDLVNDGVALLVDSGIQYVRSWDRLVSQSNINVTQSGAGDLLFTEDQKVRDVFDEALQYGLTSSNFESTYLLVYNDRTPIFGTYSSNIAVDRCTWYLYPENISNESTLEIKRDTSRIFNKIYYVWDDRSEDGAGPTLSVTPRQDLFSQAIYGVREAVLTINGVNEALAQVATDAALQIYSSPRLVMSIQVNGFIFSGGGFRDRPYMVRAGDTIAVATNNSDYANLSQGGSDFDGLKGVITGTSYSHADRSVTIDIGSEDQRLDVILSRWIDASGGIN